MPDSFASTSDDPTPATLPESLVAAPIAATAAAEDQPDSPAEKKVPASGEEGGREIIESIVIALVLMLLFRTFAAEAFVIPTGSMATTLLGRHKDVTCPECHFQYQVNASDEVNDQGELLPPSDHTRVIAGICTNCRYEARFGIDDQPAIPSYKGDRILVSKCSYDLLAPQRWDVVVFKFPAEAQTNYIKRMVGLPGETVRISHGDIFIRSPGEDHFTIARKPADKVQALLRPVHDTHFRSRRLESTGWPGRWHLYEAGDPLAAPVLHPGQVFPLSLSAPPGHQQTIVYRHLIPTQDEWRAIEQGARVTSGVRPQLVSDFTAYNTGMTAAELERDTLQGLGLHWVGDLAIDAELVTETALGTLSLQLIKAGRTHTATIDLATGQVHLQVDSLTEFAPRGQVPWRAKGGAHRVRFANVDGQLFLWWDDRLIEFDRPTTFSPPPQVRPTEADLAPARVSVAGGAVRIDRLRISRDLYYIAARNARNALRDYQGNEYVSSSTGERMLAEFLSTPALWSKFDSTMSPVDFTLAADQYFMLGDNSAASLDGRLWPGEHFVRGELLVGKAVLNFWPHALMPEWSVDVPGTEIRVPFYPNFPEMGLIR